MTKIIECDVCEHPFDLDYEADAWDSRKKKHICVLCRIDDDG